MQLDELLQKIDSNQKKINEYRPLSREEVRELDQYFKIGTTYSSNALEGNSLTLTETKILLEDGITIGGKPLKDTYEATGHAAAYEFMLEIARAGELKITEEIIRELHRRFYWCIDSEKAGCYRDHQVFISGTEYLPPLPGKVSELMASFVAELNQSQNSLHPVLLAAYAHKGLVDIHPFTDGNGRTARLLMNLILINKGLCVVSIPTVMRQEYISALVVSQRSNDPSDEPFNALIAECELEAQRDYFRMFNLAL